MEAAAYERVFKRIQFYVALLSMLFAQGSAVAQSIEFGPKLTFSALYEPSGIVHVGDGEFIVVEDEPAHPFHLVRLGQDGHFTELGEIPTEGRLYLNDLEGIAYDGRYIYVVTSHSLNKRKKEGRGRKMLVRYEYRDHRLQRPRVVRNLKAVMIKLLHRAHPDHSRGKIRKKLNIEGLAWSPLRQSLMIAFRQPVYAKQSFIIEISDPDKLFEYQSARGQALNLIQLSMKSSEIRAMSWDDAQAQFYIVTRRKKAGQKKHGLWVWSGNPGCAPLRLSRAQNRLPEGTEGITPIEAHDEFNAILVIDNGDAEKNRPAQYRLLAIKPSDGEAVCATPS